MYEREALTPDEKAELHRRRFELGRQMAEHIAQRALSQEHDMLYGRETLDWDAMRRMVWKAESDALRADPKEAFLPPEIRQAREQDQTK